MRRLLPATTFVGMLLASGVAFAQDAGTTKVADRSPGSAVTNPAPNKAASDQTAAVQEVIVTAQRTSAPLQRVPLAVTALSGSSLATMQINNTIDLTRAVPNLLVQTATASPSTVTISMRGASQTGGGFSTSESPVGFYVDDVYHARLAGTNFEFSDIDHIEVLRGPQGTLYGRNTLAGAIKLVSRQPGDDFWANAAADYGKFNEQILKGAIGGPLEPGRLAASLALVYHGADGHIFDVPLNRKVGDYDNFAARVNLHYYGNKTYEALASIWGSRDRSDGYTPIPATFPVNPATSGNLHLVAGLDRTLSPTPSSGATDQYGATVNQAWRWGGVTLRSITAFIYVKDHFRADFTGGVQTGPTTFVAGFDRTADSRDDQYSEELQLTGKALDGRLDLIGGAFWFRDTGSQQFVDRLGPGFTLLPTTLNLTTTGYAAYVQGDLHITDALSLTAGVRYSLDSKKNDATMQTSFASFTLTPVHIAKDFGASTPKVSLNYQINPTLLTYLSYAQGFQAGGFNPGALASPSTLSIPYGKESDSSIEGGIKSELLDRRLRLNAALFSTKYKDMQQLVRVSDTNPSFITQNGGDAEVHGLELEATAKPDRNLTVYGHVGLIQDRLKNLNPLSQAAILGATRLNDTPRSSGQIGFDWRVPVAVGGRTWTFLLGSDAAYSSSYYASSDNTLLTKPYTILNGFVGVAWDKWQLRGLFRNITDKRLVVCCTTGAAGVFTTNPFTALVELSWVH